MNERERWVVYPLLFLALGAALRDKLFERTTTKRIVCEELTVIDGAAVGRESPRILVRMGRSDTPPGGAARGYLTVDGEVRVTGELDANAYAYRGRAFVPGSARLVLTPADVIRALQQLQGSSPPANQN